MTFKQLLPWIGAVVVGFVGILGGLWTFLPSDVFSQLSAILFGIATLNAVMSAVGRLVLKQLGDRDIENIRTANARENERLKSELGLIAGLVNRQSDVLAKCYSALWRFKDRGDSALATVTGGEPFEQRYEAFRKELIAFEEIFQPSRLFFTIPLAQSVDEFSKDLCDAVDRFSHGRNVLDAGGSRRDDNPYQEADDAKKRLGDKFRQLHVGFQKAVGISDKAIETAESAAIAKAMVASSPLPAHNHPASVGERDGHAEAAAQTGF